MTALFLLLSLAIEPCPTHKNVTAAEKRDFLKLLVKLPTKGEFFTKKAIKTAAPHTRVLLALTVKDIGKGHIYPVLALSRGLVELKEPKKFGVKHFGKIAHPTLKLFWGSVLFDEKAASSEIVTFLRAALKSKKQSQLLSEICGPNFEDFKKRIVDYKGETHDR